MYNDILIEVFEISFEMYFCLCPLHTYRVELWYVCLNCYARIWYMCIGNAVPSCVALARPTKLYATMYNYSSNLSRDNCNIINSTEASETYQNFIFNYNVF